jgi:DNA-binding transcriptional ArsR family regulator
MDKSDVVAALAGLAHEHQLNVFRLLVQGGAQGLSAGEIGVRLNLPLPTLASALVRLEEAGLVTFRSDDVSVVYVANHDVMNDVLSYLLANCQAATGPLDAAKVSLELAKKRL